MTRISSIIVWASAAATGCTVSGSASQVDPSVCASGLQWVGGNDQSELMNPGEACISCHSQGEGPAFGAAGTVFVELHEGNDCYGAPEVTVEITDANGAVQRLATNEAGNFFTRASIAMPFSARIYDSSGAERRMVTPGTVGDCNSCHTQAGANAAPGRILAP
jgi:hypothetical protein